MVFRPEQPAIFSSIFWFPPSEIFFFRGVQLMKLPFIRLFKVDKTTNATANNYYQKPDKAYLSNIPCLIEPAQLRHIRYKTKFLAYKIKLMDKEHLRPILCAQDNVIHTFNESPTAVLII